MTGVSLNGTHSVLTFPEEVVLLLLDDEEGVPLLDRVLERIADNESPRYFAVDGKARHETGTRFSKLNNLPMDLMREEIHTGVLIAVDVVPPLYFIPAGYGDMRTFGTSWLGSTTTGQSTGWCSIFWSPAGLCDGMPGIAFHNPNRYGRK